MHRCTISLNAACSCFCSKIINQRNTVSDMIASCIRHEVKYFLEFLRWIMLLATWRCSLLSTIIQWPTKYSLMASISSLSNRYNFWDLHVQSTNEGIRPLWFLCLIKLVRWVLLLPRCSFLRLLVNNIT